MSVSSLSNFRTSPHRTRSRSQTMSVQTKHEMCDPRNAEEMYQSYTLDDLRQPAKQSPFHAMEYYDRKLLWTCGLRSWSTIAAIPSLSTLTSAVQIPKDERLPHEKPPKHHKASTFYAYTLIYVHKSGTWKWNQSRGGTMIGGEEGGLYQRYALLSEKIHETPGENFRE